MNAGGTRLTALTKDLWVHWQQTKQSWSDTKSQEFEQKYLLELFNSVERAVTVIEQLDKLTAKVRKDCEQ